MEIKELKELDIIKSALDSYVLNIGNIVKTMQDNDKPQVFIDNLEDRAVRAKELVKKVNVEVNDTLNQKVEEKINNEDIVKLTYKSLHNYDVTVHLNNDEKKIIKVEAKSKLQASVKAVNKVLGYKVYTENAIIFDSIDTLNDVIDNLGIMYVGEVLKIE